MKRRRVKKVSWTQLQGAKKLSERRAFQDRQTILILKDGTIIVVPPERLHS